MQKIHVKIGKITVRQYNYHIDKRKKCMRGKKKYIKSIYNSEKISIFAQRK